MNWNSASEFWAMGGYGLYVWGSMAVTIGLLAIEVWSTARARQNTVRQVQQSLQAQQINNDWH